MSRGMKPHGIEVKQHLQEIRCCQARSHATSKQGVETRQRVVTHSKLATLQAQRPGDSAAGAGAGSGHDFAE